MPIAKLSMPRDLKRAEWQIRSGLKVHSHSCLCDFCNRNLVGSL